MVSINKNKTSAKGLRMITPQMIEEAKNRLVKLYDPVYIFIFGVHAWGLPDILVVVDKIAPNKYRMLVEGHKALIGIKHLAKDIVIFSKEEFEEDSKDNRTLGYKINQKGKKIYAKT